MSLPSLFISHGAPDLVLQDSDAAQFLRELSTLIPAPKAIVIASAHHEANGVEVVSDLEPETIYDFGGFDPKMYELTYPAKGDPKLAVRVQGLLKDAGIDGRLNPNRGFDHGVWSPLLLVWPKANIPIVQVSIDPSKDAKYHYELGKALAPLRDEDILVIGSGHITHNLHVIFSAMRQGVMDTTISQKVEAFTNWFYEQFAAGNEEDILDWKNKAPYPQENHPTDEHLMPLFFAYGAAFSNKPIDANRLHTSTQLGSFTYEVYKFD